MHLKTKIIFVLLALSVVFFSSCEKESDPPKAIRFSVLGDSFSTYENNVTPESNDCWNYYGDIGVTNVEQMWWSQVAQSMGWILEYNNSFSGSLVCNVNYDNYYGPYSFIHRMDNLGNPDVILVFGGNNDMAVQIPLGKYVFDGWTEKDLCTFRPALAYLLHGIRHLYPEAAVYFMADVEVMEIFSESARVIADYYDVGYIGLVGIEKAWEHPNAEGMKTIANQVTAVLRDSDNETRFTPSSLICNAGGENISICNAERQRYAVAVVRQPQD